MSYCRCLWCRRVKRMGQMYKAWCCEASVGKKKKHTKLIEELCPDGAAKTSVVYFISYRCFF